MCVNKSILQMYFDKKSTLNFICYYNIESINVSKSRSHTYLTYTIRCYIFRTRCIKYYFPTLF